MTKKVRRVAPRKTALAFEPEIQEAKSRRLCLQVKPSTYDGIKAIADSHGLSVNAYVNQLLEAVLQSQ